ncbi:MAG: hypothetical protein NWQ09_00725, partial [Nonlabens sp.]|nr:hypothetical protein [Nonlabens sp.]
MKISNFAKLSVLLVILTACNPKAPEKQSESDEQAIAAVEEVVQKIFDEVWAGYDETAVTKYQT